jgi:hypothetical protein
MQIATTKGKLEFDEILIDGMKRSPIAIVPLPNNLGTMSYSITHRPTGMAIIPAKSDDLALVLAGCGRSWTTSAEAPSHARTSAPRCQGSIE